MKHTGPCFYCNTLAGPFETDHVVPTARGGPDTRQNKVCCCYKCNRSKNDLLPSEWEPEFTVPKAAIDIERSIVAEYSIKERSARGRKAADDASNDGGAYRSFYDTDPFECFLKRVNMTNPPGHLVDATVWVRDTLECARKIMESEFKGTRDPRLALEIVKLIDSRARWLDERQTAKDQMMAEDERREERRMYSDE